MYFDRFDICLAHWAFAYAWHGGQGCPIYAKFAQLDRVGFRAGPCQCTEPRALGDNAREIYKRLVIAHCGGVKNTATQEA